MNHLEAFFSLRCSREILDIVQLNHKPRKEITETMSLIKRAKKRVLLNDEWTVIDLCAGNGLLGATVSCLFPRTRTYAIDIKRPEREWERIDRFEYLTMDILRLEPESIARLSSRPKIVASIHPCGELARKPIELFNCLNAVRWLFLMPCCSGRMESSVVPDFLSDRLGPYHSWVYQLFSEVDTPHKRIYVDAKNESPKNAIIVASKDKIRR